MFVKVPGTVVDFDGTKYVLPPITIGALEQLGDKFEQLAAGKATLEHMSIVVDMVHTSLKRNYPDIARETVAGFIDIGNAESSIEAMLKRSGLTKDEDAAEANASSGETSATGKLAGST